MIEKNIVLIGMPGTGKSTVGVILAKRLGYDFLDVDILIARREGRTLPEIIEADGIEEFLRIEGEAGKSLVCSSTVIATGGSMVYSDGAMRRLRETGAVFWLDTQLHELERRVRNIKKRGIAAAPGVTVADLYRERRPLYQKYADVTIRCRGGTDNVVSQIRSELKKLGFKRY